MKKIIIVGIIIFLFVLLFLLSLHCRSYLFDTTIDIDEPNNAKDTVVFAIQKMIGENYSLPSAVGIRNIKNTYLSYSLLIEDITPTSEPLFDNSSSWLYNYPTNSFELEPKAAAVHRFSIIAPKKLEYFPSSHQINFTIFDNINKEIYESKIINITTDKSGKIKIGSITDGLNKADETQYHIGILENIYTRLYLCFHKPIAAK